jgi:methylmalonyl-CoA/ethylmalonyl-CoA epimerase
MSAKDINAEMICQVGFIVHDIESTAQKFCEIFGFPKPPIFSTPGYEQVKTTYKGEPSEATAKLAFFNTGQLQIELIEPDKTPSVWRDFLDEHGEGVHHIAFRVENTDKTTDYLAQHNIGVLQQGLYSDASGMYTYLDSIPKLGVMLELLENYKKG